MARRSEGEPVSHTCPAVKDGHECGSVLPPDRFLCQNCTNHFRNKLVDVPDLLDDLDTQVARLNVTGPTVGTSGTRTPPLPFNVYAAEVRDDLIGVLHGIYKTTGYTTSVAPVAMVESLINNMGRVVARATAPELLDELTDAVKRGVNACSAPPEKRDYGRCETEIEGEVCGTRITAPIAWTTAICPTCGHEYDLAARLAQEITDGWNAHGPISIVAEFLDKEARAKKLDPPPTVRITKQRISEWIRDGLIQAIPKPDGQHVRVREVRDTAALTKHQRARKRKATA